MLPTTRDKIKATTNFLLKRFHGSHRFDVRITLDDDRFDSSSRRILVLTALNDIRLQLHQMQLLTFDLGRLL